MTPQPAISPQRYSDISLTFRQNPVTGDITQVVDDAAVNASVINLIMTMHYEVPFHPEIGSSVMYSLFENFSPVTSMKIRSSIIEVLNNFEPRVIVIGVDVNAQPDLNGYSALIVYRIINRVDPISINVFLEKRR